MLTHRGFSACILSEGKPIPEYLVAVVDENPNTISCWIPSEVGKVTRFVHLISTCLTGATRLSQYIGETKEQKCIHAHLLHSTDS
jgi:hypothetical protein